MRLEDLILEVKYGVLLDEGPVDLPLYDGGEAGVVISVILVGIKRLQAQFWGFLNENYLSYLRG